MTAPLLTRQQHLMLLDLAKVETFTRAEIPRPHVLVWGTTPEKILDALIEAGYVKSVSTEGILLDERHYTLTVEGAKYVAKRQAVSEPKYGWFPEVRKHRVEVGPKFGSIYGGDLGGRDIYLDGERVGWVEQIQTDTYRKYSGSRLRHPTGRVTEWRVDGQRAHTAQRQMNEAIYRWLDADLRAKQRARS